MIVSGEVGLVRIHMRCAIHTATVSNRGWHVGWGSTNPHILIVIVPEGAGLVRIYTRRAVHTVTVSTGGLACRVRINHFPFSHCDYSWRRLFHGKQLGVGVSRGGQPLPKIYIRSPIYVVTVRKWEFGDQDPTCQK